MASTRIHTRSTLSRIVIWLTTGCCVCICDIVRAQERRQSISVDLGVAIPAGDRYIDKAGAPDFSLNWSHDIIPWLSVGVSAGYGRHHDSLVSDEYFGSDFISGQKEKTLHVMPVTARFDFFPMGRSEALLRPYLGFGAGVQYAKFRIAGENVDASVKADWAESFSARLGTRIYPVEGGRFFLNAECIWSYGGNSWPLAGIGSIQKFDIMAGIGCSF